MKSNKYQFKESDLLFQFAPDWLVKKFDDHKYYKTLSGYGLKGVDFIAISPHQEVYLIEVKNYRRRKRSPVPPRIDKLIGLPPPLLENYIRKVEDTLYAIRIVNRHLNRKWIYRSWLALQNILPVAHRLHQEWYFWTQLHLLLQNPQEQLKLFLWLETESEYPNLKAPQLAQIQEVLQSEITDYFKDLTPYFKIGMVKDKALDIDIEVQFLE